MLKINCSLEVKKPELWISVFQSLLYAIIRGDYKSFDNIYDIVERSQLGVTPEVVDDYRTHLDILMSRGIGFAIVGDADGIIISTSDTLNEPLFVEYLMYMSEATETNIIIPCLNDGELVVKSNEVSFIKVLTWK